MGTEGFSSTYSGVASEALPARRLCKIAAGAISLADAGERPHGIIEYFAESGANAAIRLLNVGGTMKGIAAGAFSSGALLYCRNDGKLDDVSADSAVSVGYALAAAAADGDHVEFIPL